MRLILFDIDNTLLKGTRAHQLAFVHALGSVFEIPFTLEDINVGNKPGTTDPEIMISALKRKGIPEKVIKEKLPLCFEKTAKVFPKLLRQENLVILPGVKSLLVALRTNGGLLGLVTGNLEPIAWTKMETVGLKSFFSFGAFGSDHAERSILVSLAIERAKNLCRGDGRSDDFFFKGIYLIGDTIRDILAGKRVGVKTIAVATGNVPKEELQEAGADLVVETLAETEKLLSWISQG